ncbi:LON peptidase substrate-binding domain-containing protein [Ancylobacter pratisalsi]|uniref:LON peptidase substrate-binding domain-containing protein n=1 Tax=Ancylobacter pratisalsi TaxID=1745854 RepID=A0A6P1YMB1_9HYPH|nr:LON peptidase substrate-binding domain-containing protein [Ancylobacter pratisalsi]QIB34100.1 LON peptidase substrate-binding domain-containing protein [Ancylobacter pratisalsi]
MAINRPYGGPTELPRAIPLFPLEGALLLPRCQMPLNIFEPRYLAMVDAALAGERVIGLIQPIPALVTTANPALQNVGCVGRITEFAESGDGRYLVTLTGITRFRVVAEVEADTPFRQGEVDYTAFEGDFTPGYGAEEVDRATLLRTLAAYLDANKLEADWSSITEAPNEALVNALAMMSPFGAREKQALLEAASLAARADMLVAVTEMAMARTGGAEGEGSLQ